MKVFSKKLLLAMLIFALDFDLSADEKEPVFTAAEYHNMLSADLQNIARYSGALRDLAAGGNLKQNLELVKAQVKQIGDSLNSAEKDLAVIMSNNQGEEMNGTREHFESIKKSLALAENAYNGIVFEVNSGDMNAGVIRDNAATMHDAAKDAEENHHRKIMEMVGVFEAPLEAPPDIKEDLEIENE
jgi:hypothetical protein